MKAHYPQLSEAHSNEFTILGYYRFEVFGQKTRVHTMSPGTHSSVITDCIADQGLAC